MDEYDGELIVVFEDNQAAKTTIPTAGLPLEVIGKMFEHGHLTNANIEMNVDGNIIARPMRDIKHYFIARGDEFYQQEFDGDRLTGEEINQ